jgi:predicted lysophospholipase L1 biosynthesis ABC-type transport system permease subunit
MVSLGDAALLAEIKAVSAGYPLRGSLAHGAVLNAADAATTACREPAKPGPTSAWRLRWASRPAHR